MRLLTTEQVAERLGVKPATVYAYVSRGLLPSRRNAAGKGSLFDKADVDALIAGRKRATPNIQTGITLIRDGGLFYRGHDAVELARTRTYEEVAGLLWTSEPQASPFRVDAGLRELAERVGALLPASARLADRLRVTVATIAAADPLRFDTSPVAVVTTGRTLIGTMVAALPVRGQPPASSGGVSRSFGSASVPSGAEPVPSEADLAPSGGEVAPPGVGAAASGVGAAVFGAAPVSSGGEVAPSEAGPVSLAELLWPRLTQRPMSEKDRRMLEVALILLADHDIAASTLAARVAASTRAHPYAVISAGLAALDGPLHGAASEHVYPLLARAVDGADPVAIVSEHLRSGGGIPGFGHPLYPSGDPRATVLLDLLGDHPVREAAAGLADAVRTRSGILPNIDLALAALTLGHDMPADAGEAIFAVARTAGWLAHALEEYANRPARFR
ncbi:citrate/2-methylcitrate synthase, partial [Actinoplanes regularis]